jgi:anti-sigma factor RsiW
MTCDEILARLDDLRAGTLPADESARVRAHLADCGSCAADFNFLVRLEADIARLPAEIEPQRDVWPDIEARLPPSGRPARRWLAAAAVITLLAIGGTVAAGLLSPGPTPPDGLAIMETEYSTAALELLTTVEAREEALAPGVVRVVEQNLEITDQAISELRDALRQRPGDPGLALMLRAAWEKKLDLLRRAAASTEA